jgi:hypothetical protein
LSRASGDRRAGAPVRIRVEKRKWDGSLTSVVTAWLVDVRSDVLCWFVPSGTGEQREGGRASTAHDEIWVTAPGKWWVLCGVSGTGGGLAVIEVHAAAPIERLTETLVSWIDLDLDFVVRGDHAELVDIDGLHARSRALGLPASAVHAAWAGIAELAPCFTTREWPFDGTLEHWLAAARELR